MLGNLHRNTWESLFITCYEVAAVMSDGGMIMLGILQRNTWESLLILLHAMRLQLL